MKHRKKAFTFVVDTSIYFLFNEHILDSQSIKTKKSNQNCNTYSYMKFNRRNYVYLLCGSKKKGGGKERKGRYKRFKY